MTYAGLCVDGPMDGQRYECWTGVVKVEVRPPVKITDGPAPAPEAIGDIATATYKHHDVKGTGLWLLEDETPEQAVQHMVNCVGVEALAYRYEQIVARRKDDANHGR